MTTKRSGRFSYNFMKQYYDPRQVHFLAKEMGWELIDQQNNIALLSYKKNGVRINIYWSRGTVGTAMEHPTKGKTQLFRKKVEWKELKKILTNPRVHTDKGYYQKK